MTLYQVKGAVHGFAIEWYRVDGRCIELLGRTGVWQPARLDLDDIGTMVRDGRLQRVDWRYYLDGFTGWRYRVAGPFVQMFLQGQWRTTGAVKSLEIPELVQGGVLSEYSA